MLKRLIRWAFLWKGRQHVNRGYCLVAWEKVQRPLDLGGLGIPILQLMGWSLQARWLWFRRTETSRQWIEFDISEHHHVVALFQIGTEWIMGCSGNELALLVVEVVPAKVRNQRLVADALLNLSWTRDIQSSRLSMIVWFEFFHLVDILEEIGLSHDVYVHMWRLDISR